MLWNDTPPKENPYRTNTIMSHWIVADSRSTVTKCFTIIDGYIYMIIYKYNASTLSLNQWMTAVTINLFCPLIALMFCFFVVSLSRWLNRRWLFLCMRVRVCVCVCVGGGGGGGGGGWRARGGGRACVYTFSVDVYTFVIVYRKHE